MKLSEAIRKGAEEHQQAFGVLFEEDASGNYAVCALGAAYVAASGKMPKEPDSEETYGTLLRYFPCLDTPVTMPDFPSRLRLETGIIHRNDSERMSLFEIADWVEGLGY